VKDGWPVRDRWKLAVPLALVLAALALGCAKRPLSSAARESAPAPDDGRGAMGRSVATSTAAQTGAGGAGTTEGAGAGGAGGSGASGGPASKDAGLAGVARPDPRQFAAAPRLRDIHFDFDKYAIRPDDAKILDANVDWLISNPDYLVLIEGHCDERGTNQYNLALGDHRARAALNYMIARGVEAERITTISYGKERPACIARTEACWAMNRRAHFLVKAARLPR
jgi:peptidoglycan-associated lipoprotein